ncbi:MAG: hypothetical protein LUD81_03570 [Clostridiales bacterium]|nr:hypothetical protein [Clostridiales bacterium]
MDLSDVLKGLFAISEAVKTVELNKNPTERTFEHNLHMDCKYFKSAESSSRFKDTDKLERKLAIRNDDVVYLAYDDSFWHDGSEGFIITYRGIFARAPYSDVTNFTTYDKLSCCNEVYLKRDNSIYAGNYYLGCVNSLSDEGKERVVSLFNSIRYDAIKERKRVNGE